MTPAEFAALHRLTPAEAVAYLAGRGKIVATYDWRDLWQGEHAHQFTVSRLARLDILKSIQDGITASVAGDLSRRDFTRDLTALLQKEGWWGKKAVTDPATGEVVTTDFSPARVKLIYDVNTRQAHAAGRWERMERNAGTHPYIRYITKRDERVRASHREWDNLTLPVGHAFWDTHAAPNGWRCRCRLMSMTQAEYDAGHAPTGAELKKVAPPVKMRDWENKRTGEVMQVPAGIDPGFGYNPGKAAMRKKALDQVVADKLALRSAGVSPALTVEAGETPALRAGLAAAAERAGLRDNGGMTISSLQEIAAFLDGTETAPIAVAVIPDDITSALSARTNRLWLSRYTAEKQRKHPEITAESYAWLQDLIDNGERLYDKAKHATVIQHREQPYVAVLKAAADGREIYLQSFRRSDAKNIAALKKRSAGGG